MTLDDLRNYRALRSEIEGMEEELRSLYYPVRSPNTASIGSSGNSVSNPTEDSAMRAIQQQERINAKIQQMRDMVEEIEAWLETVDNLYVRSSIRWHYLLGKSWKWTTEKVFGEYYSDNNSRIIVERYFGIR